MLPPGNTLRDLFVYAHMKWNNLPDEDEKDALMRVLAEDLLEVPYMDLRHPERVRFTESQLLAWMRAVKRVGAHEPVQYVTGKAPFYGLMFAVNPSVLIPRPETEELVALVFEKTPINRANRVIDFCTGSGCIPVTVKKHFPRWELTATDVSEAAIETAKANAATHGTEITFFTGDVLTPEGVPEGGWDVIISNPPYVAQSEEDDMHERVLQHEPHLALFVPDDDTLRFYRRLAEIASERLNPGGQIFAEINPHFADATAELFGEKGLQAELVKDLSGKWRFVHGKLI